MNTSGTSDIENLQNSGYVIENLEAFADATGIFAKDTSFDINELIANLKKLEGDFTNIDAAKIANTITGKLSDFSSIYAAQKLIEKCRKYLEYPNLTAEKETDEGKIEELKKSYFALSGKHPKDSESVKSISKEAIKILSEVEETKKKVADIKIKLTSAKEVYDKVNAKGLNFVADLQDGLKKVKDETPLNKTSIIDNIIEEISKPLESKKSYDDLCEKYGLVSQGNLKKKKEEKKPELKEVTSIDDAFTKAVAEVKETMPEVTNTTNPNKIDDILKQTTNDIPIINETEDAPIINEKTEEPALFKEPTKALDAALNIETEKKESRKKVTKTKKALLDGYVSQTFIYRALGSVLSSIKSATVSRNLQGLAISKIGLKIYEKMQESYNIHISSFDPRNMLNDNITDWIEFTALKLLEIIQNKNSLELNGGLTR